MITPVIPPQSPLQELIHGPLTTTATRVADSEVVYGMCTVGEAGRVLDKQALAVCRLPRGRVMRYRVDGLEHLRSGEVASWWSGIRCDSSSYP